MWRRRLYILEKLEGLDGAPRVGEKQPQVILGHILSVKRCQSRLETGTEGSHTGGAGESKPEPSFTARALGCRPRYLRDVGQVQGGRRREDVLEVLGTGLLEAMQRRVGVVFGESLVVQAVPGQRHGLVLGQGHTDDLPIHLLAV